MVQILDQYGRPLNKEVLKAPQTSRTFELHRDWPTHPSRGMTIARLPRLLEAAERGDLAAPGRHVTLRGDLEQGFGVGTCDGSELGHVTAPSSGGSAARRARRR